MSSSTNNLGRSSTTGHTGEQSVNRMVGYGFGAVYLLVGLLGLFVADGFTGWDARGSLLGFSVNHLHNIVHLAVGALLIYGASKGTETARRVNLTVGAVYALTFVYGLLANGDKDGNFLAINGADNGLHAASSLLLLGVALFADKAHRRSTV